MPAKSPAQAHLMQMALAVKTGAKDIKEMPEGAQKDIRGLLRSMTDKQLREFTAMRSTPPKKHYVGVRTR